MARSKPACCSCSLAPTTLCRQRLGGNCEWLFDQTLLVTPMAQCTDLLLASVAKGTRNMWFQHEGAAANFARQIWEHVFATYKVRWIGRCGPVVGPSRSPDLWCHIKALIYTWQFDSEEDLIARIVKAVATTRQQSAILSALITLWRRRRCRLCIEIWDPAFEHLP